MFWFKETLELVCFSVLWEIADLFQDGYCESITFLPVNRVEKTR